MAELPESGKIVGSVMIDFIKLGLDNETRDGAYFNFLKVHPASRRQGVATGLIERAANFAKDRIGDQRTGLARIQNDKKASLISAEK